MSAALFHQVGANINIMFGKPVTPSPSQITLLTTTIVIQISA